MAVYTVRTRDVFVLGNGWYGQPICYQYTLPRDVAADRKSIQAWLDTHAGDFSHISDFAATIEEVEILWRDEENDFVWNYAMYSTGE